MKKLLIILLFCFLLGGAGPAFALSIENTGIDASVLINTILADNTFDDNGYVAIDSDSSYNGNAGEFVSGGTFSRIPAEEEGDNPQFTSGIALSTGWYNEGIPTDDPSGYYSHELELPADEDIADTILANGDATKLEFDISTSGGAVSFDYIFASEESYWGESAADDAFGFYIYEIGEDGQYADTAAYSYTRTYWEILGGSVADASFASPESSPLYGETVFDDITNPVHVLSSDLSAGFYHIKFVVADGPWYTEAGSTYDPVADSAVFIDAGSFSFNPGTIFPQTASPVPEPATMILFGLGLAGLARLSRKKNNR